MRESALRSFDGTRLVYQVGGTGERWLVIANGYGGTFSSWHGIMPLLTPHYRVLIWDYRGTHASQAPHDRAALTIADQCRDLEVLLAHEGIDRFALAGWSVGVQVALEVARRQPDRVEALALINGASERILHRIYGGGPVVPFAVPSVAVLRRMAPLFWPAMRPAALKAAGSPLFARLCALAGVTSGRPAMFRETAQGLLALDMGIFLRMVGLADRHSRAEALHQLRMPVLVTAGTRDALTPPRVCRPVADAIEGAQYWEIDGGTHYALLEQPDAIAGALRRFLDG